MDEHPNKQFCADTCTVESNTSIRRFTARSCWYTTSSKSDCSEGMVIAFIQILVSIIVSVSVCSEYISYKSLENYQAGPLGNNGCAGDLQIPETASYYDYGGEKIQSSHFHEYPGASNNGESRSEVTKSIVLKAIRDLKSSKMR